MLADREVQLCAAEEERRQADTETAAFDADVAAMRGDAEEARAAAAGAARQLRAAAGRDEQSLPATSSIAGIP
jgi:hypothetical protein